MFKNYYNKLIKRFFSSKGIDPLRAEASPYRDWKIIAISFFIVLAASIGFNAYLSFQINNDSFFSTAPQQSEGAVFNRDGLQKVLSDLAVKDAILLAAPQASTTVVDPSL